MYRIGIDAGSKTLKLVVLDEADDVVYSTYMRHRANIVRTLGEAVHDLDWRRGTFEARVAMTGSAAIEVARALGIPFVQEVVATTHAVRTLAPQADVAIELGGEDAKIIYLDGAIEQRMNATCAGGTGGFIDTIAYMLDAKSDRMSQMAFSANRSYPIASRCAVFAQTDVRPLLNAGASKNDIAASVFDAVVRQTLGGLACGRPIRGTVVFLGGPLEHMPYLVYSFRRALDLDNRSGIKPPNAHLFTAMGTALLSDDEVSLGQPAVTMSTVELLGRIESLGALENELERLPVLFADESDLAAFRERHARASFERRSIYEAQGPLYLGIDAGSTTLKLVALDGDRKIVHSVYERIRGDMIETLREALDGLYRKIMPPDYLPHAEPRMWIAGSCATGYGEELLRAAFGVDTGIVETAAHLRAARELCADLTFLLDIGGQDMKALWVRDGMVRDAALNEACSSGCGAFVEGTAAALKRSVYQFADEALFAKEPIDLGTKCTVFMNSRVKHAQKAGAPVEDIAAGVAYSVVKNALHRIIGADRAPRPGDRVVVQGGTFKSDAVLRAFEQITGVEALRPEQAHLMGAIGCALVARDAAGDSSSALIGPDDLAAMKVRRRRIACTGCANACMLSVVTFDDEGARHFISDNKCERGLEELNRKAGEHGAPGAGAPAVTSSAPNLVALEQRLVAGFSDTAGRGSRAAITVGLSDSMALYAYRPFWHTLLAHLGFSIVVPEPGCESDAASEAWETIPSESVCYPAKTAHLRYFSLCKKGSDAVLMPRFERAHHCPVQAGYARALAGTVDVARTEERPVPLVSPLLSSYKPRRFARDEASADALLDALNDIVSRHPERSGQAVLPSRHPERSGEAAASSRHPERSGEAAESKDLALSPPPQPMSAPAAITRAELDAALEAALAAQESVDVQLEAATGESLAWLAEDPARHGIVLAGRPYHVDEALLHGIDRELNRLGFAVFGAAGLASRASACTSAFDEEAVHPWVPAKRLVRLAHLVADNPQLDAVFLQSFGCGFEAVSLEEVRDVLDAAGKPCTVLKLDDISDLAHIRIRLRTLATAIDMRGAAASRHPKRADDAVASLHRTGSASFLASIAAQPLGPKDLDVVRRCGVKDACFTANIQAARVIRMLRDDPSITRVELPRVCETCITQAIPRIVERACGATPEYSWVDWPATASPGVSNTVAACPTPHATLPTPRIGIVGNPLLVFDAFMNEGLLDMLEDLGCEPVFPDPALVTCEDVRYLDQLAIFDEAGVHDVIYVLSFGCLKGHVSARGALRELQQRFPRLRITIIDYDPESSALNRENRLRLAVHAARMSPPA